MKITHLASLLFITLIGFYFNVSAAPQSPLKTIPIDSYELFGTSGDQFRRFEIKGGKTMYCYHQNTMPVIDLRKNTDLDNAFSYSGLNINMAIDYNMYCRALNKPVEVLYQLN